MKKSGIRWSGLGMILALSLSAQARSYKTYLCNRTESVVGAPTYILIVDRDATADEAGSVILSQNRSTGSSAWTLIGEDAHATETPDGKSLQVSYSDDAGRIDWSNPNNADKCYVTLKDTYRFDLSAQNGTLAGEVTIAEALARNPNKTQCPQVMPLRPITFGVACVAQ